ncbi:DNA-deoxyinosine glycosylase [Irregularibacter muris]|uniref:DNA-deoxyinosine glycosylase n=1 Tax=Irregularibacter muris TaxID=1796619 RepID=A0AAE3HGE0_9FIRM|nr:DNA-deoxyinosine glycosylase [Irregularibacter muris]MCR1898618.1 DNA-deoxyinosine glycosylase [Irregularibacter muris]
MIEGFLPIIDNNSEILILGTMPGGESLKKQEYYAYGRNQFWKIIFSLLKGQATDDYEEKKKILLESHIGVWDVLKSCDRKGSLDVNIKNPQSNNFKLLFEQYPKIKQIYFNGKTAEKLYRKLVARDTEEYNIELIGLPSTSPANAISFEKKLEAWKKIIN